MAALSRFRSIVAQSGGPATATVLAGIYAYSRLQSVLGSGAPPEDGAAPRRSLVQEALVRFGLARREMSFKMRDGSRVRSRIVDAGGLLSVYVDHDYDVPGIDWGAIRSIVDVGAHIGSFTVWAARRAPDARCLAVEPNPETFALLSQNLRRNALTGRVQAINVAVAGESGAGTLEFTDHSLGTRLSRGGAGQVAVKISTLADLLSEAQIAQIDLLKIDCEGMEYEVLGGLPRDLLQGIRTVACEYHPMPPHEVGELDQVLGSAGFRVQRTDSPLGILWATR